MSASNEPTRCADPVPPRKPGGVAGMRLEPDAHAHHESISTASPRLTKAGGARPGWRHSHCLRIKRPARRFGLRLRLSRQCPAFAPAATRPRVVSLATSTIVRADVGAGGVAERLKAHAWKACIRATVSRVRIPLPPPQILSRSFSYLHERPWNSWHILPHAVRRRSLS